MVKVRKNRIPRDWSKVTKERNFTSSLEGMKAFHEGKERPEAEIIRVKEHRQRIRDEIAGLEEKASKMPDPRDTEKAMQSRDAHAELEAKILRKKRLLSMFDNKVRVLDSKIVSANRRAAKLKAKMSQKIAISMAMEKAEREKEREKAKKLTQDQKNELYRVFPEQKKVRIETVGGKRRLKVKSKKPFSLS